MYFSELKIHGFKSFCDAAELWIEPGMTGIVGPNGCGKSNVIEAIRWVMGESSAKKMRGGEMDDVIFGGSKYRRGRNLAKVTLVIEGAGEQAPFGFKLDERLEITRKIERGEGSSYSINGKEVRARDIQLFFADMASGAGSSAIVSQGRIGAIIAAKPSERRLLIEEAAGIRGLHSRRHEAELKLNATDSNLLRLQDLLGAKQSQYEGLARQLRQVIRYRKLGEQIRHTQACLLQKQYYQKTSLIDSILKQQAQAKEVQLTLEAEAIRAVSLKLNTDRLIPELRQKEAQAAKHHQDTEYKRLMLTSKLENHARSLSQNQVRLEEINRDLERARNLEQDATKGLESYHKHLERIASQRLGLPEEIKNITQALHLLQMDLQAKENETNQETSKLAGFQALKTQSNQELSDLDLRQQQVILAHHNLIQIIAEEERLSGNSGAESETNLANLEAEEARIKQTITQIEGNIQQQEQAFKAIEGTYLSQQAKLVQAHQKNQQLEQSSIKQEQQLRQNLTTSQNQAYGQFEKARIEAWQQAMQESQKSYDQALNQLHQSLALKRQQLASLEGDFSRLKAALAIKEIGEERNGDNDKLLDQLTIPKPIEAAFAACFEQELAGSLDQNAEIYWRDDLSISASSKAPDFEKEVAQGVIAMITYFDHPPRNLIKLLSFIGIAKDKETAIAAQSRLPAGAILTTMEGGLWRWDGLVKRIGLKSRAETELKQRREYQELCLSLPLAKADYADQEIKQLQAIGTLDAKKLTAQQNLTQLRDQSLNDKKNQLNQDIEQQLTQIRLDHEINLKASQAEISLLANELQAIDTNVKAARQALESSKQHFEQNYQALNQIRKSRTQLEERLSEQRKTHQLRQQQVEAFQSERMALENQKSGLVNRISQIPDLETMELELRKKQESLSLARQGEYQTRSKFDDLKQRLTRLDHEENNSQREATNWRNRKLESTAQIQDLEQRADQIRLEIEALNALPPLYAQEKEALELALQQSLEHYDSLKNGLQEAEILLREADAEERRAERKVQEQKEQLIRIESSLIHENEQKQEISYRIAEKLNGLKADALSSITLIEDSDQLPNLDDLQQKHERLQKEREALGAVNLRAEEESELLAAEIKAMEVEQADLSQAIAKLQEAIQTLNQEGRQKLKQAFDGVNLHFQRLFLQLFGGGEASLALIEGDDPLASGLEIMARPPGKKMQVLSLLSGGEQALTALALIFAMFLTNPAPICILDEVDAPLDDANVDRFLTLLTQIAKESKTRFLLVTHHRMTMARADRLYGVTMAEEGVSQIVSVDLGKAASLAE